MQRSDRMIILSNQTYIYDVGGWTKRNP